MTPKRRETFADAVAKVKAEPARRSRARPGRSADGNRWTDPSGFQYHLVNERLAPERAVTLATGGALVVYDACGCGGTECRLVWLRDADLSSLDIAPHLHPSKGGLARVAEWRSESGQVLIEVAGEVSWGDRIDG